MFLSLGLLTLYLPREAHTDLHYLTLVPTGDRRTVPLFPPNSLNDIKIMADLAAQNVGGPAPS